MPCYLFTYHSHGSWLPDREQGYVHWKKGSLPADAKRAEQYREKMVESEAVFDHLKQRVLLSEIEVASGFQGFRFHAAATETTHVHVLASWKDERPWLKLRNSIKQSLNLRLNKEFERRTWFVKGASRRHVEEQDHFDYLLNVYLPKHRSWKWSEGRGEYL